MDKDRNWRVKSYASDVNKEGFTIHIDSWSDTILYSGSVSWIAYPSNRPNITSGLFSTTDGRPSSNPHVKEGCASFQQAFGSAPKLLAALSSFDIRHERNLRLNVATNDLTSKGFSWKIESWCDTVLHSASATFLAIEDY
jgi:hypothetical protein